MPSVKRFIKRLLGREKAPPRKLQVVASKEDLQHFLYSFEVDDYGHQANIVNGDLGYGWIHYSLVRVLKPKAVLCIGSRFGYAPAVLAQACKDNGLGHVYFVDAGFGDEDQNNWTGVGFWKTEKGKKLFKNFELDNFITPFIMTTQEFADRYPDTKFDYVYIDGDHSFKGANTDYQLFWPMLNEGGMMSFHDICVKETLPEGEYGVHKVWQKIKSTQKTVIEFPFLGSGLGVVQKSRSPRSVSKPKKKTAVK